MAGSSVCGRKDVYGGFVEAQGRLGSTAAAEHIQTWVIYRSELVGIASFSIPRWTNYTFVTEDCKLHGLADASQRAIRAVAYSRVRVSEGDYQVSLVIVKTKVTRMGKTSIPRLELCAAVLLVCLMSYLRSALNFPYRSLVIFSLTWPIHWSGSERISFAGKFTSVIVCPRNRILCLRLFGIVSPELTILRIVLLMDCHRHFWLVTICSEMAPNVCRRLRLPGPRKPDRFTLQSIARSEPSRMWLLWKWILFGPCLLDTRVWRGYSEFSLCARNSVSDAVRKELTYCLTRSRLILWNRRDDAWFGISLELSRYIRDRMDNWTRSLRSGANRYHNSEKAYCQDLSFAY